MDMRDAPGRMRRQAYNDPMIPIRDVIPSRTTPFVTVTLLLLERRRVPPSPASAVTAFENFVRTWGVTPASFEWSAVFTRCSCTAAGCTCGNMLFLWIFGDNVEDRMGHGRYLVFYVLCGARSRRAQVLAEPASSSRWSGQVVPLPAYSAPTS